MSLLARRVRTGLERRAGEWGDSSIPSNGSLGFSVAGVSVTEDTALSIAAVYSCIRVLTDAVSTIPLRSYRGVGAKKEMIPLSGLLRRPSVEISRIDWFVQATMSLGLRGNLYGNIIERDARLFPAQIQLVHPDHAQVRRVTSGPDKGRPEYRFNGQAVPIDDVFHLRYLSVPGSLVGLNPIQALRLGFGIAHATDSYGAGFFENSANPSGILSVPGDLSDDETLAMAMAWKEAHGGVNKAHLPAILTGGTKWEQISIAPDDAQFIQTRQFSQAEMAMIFGIPVHWIGVPDRSPTATGVEDQERMFNNLTLNGYLRRFEEAFSDPAVSPGGQYVEFDLDERLKGDFLTRMQGYTLARNASIMTSDECRDKEGMAPLPDGIGENILLPMNMAAIGPDGKPVVLMAPKPVQNGGEPQPPTGLDDPAKKNPPKGQDA